MNSKKIPTCVGIIMDGNRRWAKKRGLPTLVGHERGAEVLKDVARAGWKAGVKEVIFYAFSTENWKRSKEEIRYLMKLLEDNLKDISELEENIRVRFIGAIDQLSTKLQSLIRKAEEDTAQNTGGTLVLAFSYGGRAEILNAVNSLIEEGVKAVNEEDFIKKLWTHDISDPDLIIRTGGERRLSNFLPWQSMYSELFFTDTQWPDFSREELSGILEEYANRERRHGK